MAFLKIIPIIIYYDWDNSKTITIEMESKNDKNVEIRLKIPIKTEQVQATI